MSVLSDKIKTKRLLAQSTDTWWSNETVDNRIENSNHDNNEENQNVNNNKTDSDVEYCICKRKYDESECSMLECIKCV